MDRFLGVLLGLNVRVDGDIFSGWISPSRPLMLKNFLSWKNHSVAIKVSEITYDCFANAAFPGKFSFPMCKHSVKRDKQVY